MDNYSLKILKLLKKQGTQSKENFYKTMCPAIVEMCIKELQENDFLIITDKLYNVSNKNDVIQGEFISLSLKGLSFIEEYKRDLIDIWITRILAIWGSVTGTIAIFAQLVQLFLIQPK